MLNCPVSLIYIARSHSKLLVGLVFILLILPVLVLAVSIKTQLVPKALSPETLTSSQRALVSTPSFATFAKLTQDLLDQEAASALTQKRLDAPNIRLSYSPSVWKTFDTPIDSAVGEQSFTFQLRSGYGYGSITVNPSTKAQLKQAIRRGKTRGSENIDDLDAIIVGLQKELTGEATLVNKERLILNGTNAYHLVLSQSYFGNPSTFEKYLIVHNDRYVLLTVRYDQLGGTRGRVTSLVESLTLLPGTNQQNVHGASTQAGSLETVQLVELVRPSVVNILKLQCNSLASTRPEELRFITSSYRFCSGTKGSGLIVTSDGHVATNGHVIKTYPEQALTTNLFEPNLEPFLINLVREVHFAQTQEELSPGHAASVITTIEGNPSEVNSLITFLYELLDKQFFTLKEDGTRYFVKVGNDPFTFDESLRRSGDLLNSVKLSSSIFQAELVDVEYPNYFSPDAVLRKTKVSGPDIALLKILTPGSLIFPALPLGDTSSLQEGSSLVVIGYPGLVEGDLNPEANSLIDYTTSSVKPTITRGIVSAIKKDEGGRQLVQTDASIDHGNSGGPAFNENAEVIGIATYGFNSSSGNFNFLRDTVELKTLLEKHHLDTSRNPVYDEWKRALGYYWANSYTRSLNSFNEVVKQYPIHPTVTSYIADAKQGIHNGQDVGLIFGIEKTSFVLGAVVVGIFLLGLALALGAILSQSHRQPFIPAPALSPLPHRTQREVATLPPTPLNTAVVQPPIQVPPMPTVSA